MESTFILAIETSCDDTSVAIVADGQRILANVISSQIATHEKFGGVVPEVASRQHVEVITQMMELAIEKANLPVERLDAIAVTQGPGLVGSLLVGMIAGKSLSLAWDKPFIGVHHIAGHIYANQFVQQLQYPLLALVVSGGHTELIHMPAEGVFEIIGQTRDDAVGEAYDKVARSLGLPYPGGPHIDRLAHEAVSTIDLPRAWMEPDSYDFSFSGLKSAVLGKINQAKMKQEPLDHAALAHGFQTSVIDVLVTKAMRAAKQYRVQQLLLCGGVAANRGLRAELTARANEKGLTLLIPPYELCTDNAAMIGAAAYLKWTRKQFSSLHMLADPGLSLTEWMSEEHE